MVQIHKPFKNFYLYQAFDPGNSVEKNYKKHSKFYGYIDSLEKVKMLMPENKLTEQKLLLQISKKFSII